MPEKQTNNRQNGNELDVSLTSPYRKNHRSNNDNRVVKSETEASFNDTENQSSTGSFSGKIEITDDISISMKPKKNAEKRFFVSDNNYEDEKSSDSISDNDLDVNKIANDNSDTKLQKNENNDKKRNSNLNGKNIKPKRELNKDDNSPDIVPAANKVENKENENSDNYIPEEVEDDKALNNSGPRYNPNENSMLGRNFRKNGIFNQPRKALEELTEDPREKDRKVSEDSDKLPFKNEENSSESGIDSKKNSSDVKDSSSNNSSNKSSNKSKGLPLGNKNSEDNKEKSSESVKENAENFVVKAKNILVHLSKYWKVYLIAGGIILGILLIMLFLLLMEDESESELANDQSTGVIVRQPPESSYTCDTDTSLLVDDISVTDTPLSREEFISKVQAYDGASSAECGSSGAKRAWKYLADNAGLIYDTAKSIGFNPELIYLRAASEGFTPSCLSKYESYHNYWGLKCFNGEDLSTCYNFSSLEDAIYNEKIYWSFFNWVSKHLSAGGAYSETFGSYATLQKDDNTGLGWPQDGFKLVNGKPSYSSCRWGLGGCCYSYYIEPYLLDLGYSNRPNEIHYACEVAKQKTKVYLDIKNWYKDSNMDQRAYSLWQTSKIIQTRQAVFGLGADSSIKSGCNKKITTDITELIKNNNTGDYALKGKAYYELLLENNSNIDNVNAQLLDVIVSSGVGTREAVVNAGKFLVNAFEVYNKKLPYQYIGGHDSFNGKDGKKAAYPNHEYYGINPYFGANLGTPIVRSASKTYYYVGLDCSGFVSWALHNAGLTIPDLKTADYMNDEVQKENNLIVYPIFDTLNIIRPGDVLVKNDGDTQHHAALIVEYSDDPTDPYIVVIEEFPNGLQVKTRHLNDASDRKYLSIFSVAHLDYWYDEAPKVSDFKNTFTNGLIKVD